jgi:hypothetical protein
VNGLPGLRDPTTYPNHLYGWWVRSRFPIGSEVSRRRSRLVGQRDRAVGRRFDPEATRPPGMSSRYRRLTTSGA